MNRLRAAIYRALIRWDAVLTRLGVGEQEDDDD